MLGKLTCCCDHACTFSPSLWSVESCLSTLREIHPRRWWVHQHAPFWLCSVTLSVLWQKLIESSCFALLFFLFQVTMCLAMYIVTMLGIIISFCWRLSLLFQLRYYAFFNYYTDARGRVVSSNQTGHKFPFHSIIWNDLHLVSLSSSYSWLDFNQSWPPGLCVCLESSSS